MTHKITPPLWLLAELTYRCPLQCPYCSNPLELGKAKEELSTEQWKRVFKEARVLGALQLGFSGGEPLLRKDLVELTKTARDLGYYTNLITSSGGDKALYQDLKKAGLDHVQISFESKNKETNKLITGSGKSYQQKIDTAKIIKDLGYPLVFNCVIHKHNIHEIGEILDFAYELKSDYVELANTQYYGWALENISELLPTRQELEEARAVVVQKKKKYPKMEIIFVIPDYYETRPKPCMQGMGSIFLTINPYGVALPCHSAKILPLDFPSVKEHSIKHIWEESDGFNHFRGFEWMKDPCRSCDQKEKDFGGCRCQAYALTGDMYAADPVCSKSSSHNKIQEAIGNAVQEGKKTDFIYRNQKNSTKITSS